MSRINKFIKIAKKYTEESSHRWRMAAILISGSQIISVGINKKKTHPLQKGKHAYSIHAELDCLISAPFNKIKGSYIVVCRKLTNGDLALAKPCNECQKLLKEYGIKKVYYSISDSKIGEILL